MSTVINTEVHAAEKERPAHARTWKTGRRKKVFAVSAAAIGLLAVSAWGVRYWLWAGAHEETDDAYIAGHVHPVSARVAGAVENVLVDDNQHVEANQVLVRLDPRDYQVRVAEVEAALAVARRQAATASTAVDFSSQNAAAQSTEADGGIRSAEAAIATAEATLAEATAGISKAQAALSEAEANRRRAELDFQRYGELVTKDQVSRQQYDHARAAYDAAAAAKTAATVGVHQAESRAAQARESVGHARALLIEAQGKALAARAGGTETSMRRLQHETALASVQQAQTLLQDAKLQLSYAEVRSPVGGRIGKKGVEAGQRIQPGQPLLAVVEDDVWIVANFKETQLTHMKAGQHVDVSVDSFPDRTFAGIVDSVSPGTGAQFALLPPDNATGNFTKIVQRVPVKIRLNRESVRGEESRLVPGMSVTAVVTVD
jgi:membrane fusion protein (multidrug efflux system)